MPAAAYPSAWSTLRQRYCDVPVFHAAGVIALDVQRAGLALATVERAASDSRDFLIVDDGHAIAHHRHVAPHERHIVALPLPRPRRHFGGGRQEAVDRAHALKLVIRSGRFVLHLYFVPAAQVHAAVSILRAV